MIRKRQYRYHRADRGFRHTHSSLFHILSRKTASTFAPVALTTVIDAISAVATRIECTIIDVVVTVFSLETWLALALVAAFLVDALATVLTGTVWAIGAVFITLVNVFLTTRSSPPVDAQALCLVVGVLVTFSTVLTQVRLAGVDFLIAVLANVAVITGTLDVSAIWRRTSSVFAWIRTITDD